MDENLYFLDVGSLRTHLYDLSYEYKHNAFQSYDQEDPLYEVNEETWERILRRLDALVETYGFGNYSIDIAFAFKTLGVKPGSATNTCTGPLGRKLRKHNKIVMFGMLFKRSFCPKYQFLTLPKCVLMIPTSFLVSIESPIKFNNCPIG